MPSYRSLDSDLSFKNTLKLLRFPKYWTTALAIFCAYLLSFLPFFILEMMGKQIGKLAFKYVKHRKNITLRNLSLCYPKLSDTEIHALAKANFETAGVAIFEIAMAWFASNERINALFRYEGLEHLKAAEQEGRGIILLTAHSCSLELAGRALSAQFSLQPMYRKHKNLLFDNWQRLVRAKYSKTSPIERGNVRAAIRALKLGRKMWYAPDQNYGGTYHVFVPFFDIPTLTITATSKLAKITNALVVPYYVFKKCDKKGKTYYLIRFYEALQDFPSHDMTRDCRRLNQLFETWINEHPEQYLWAHRRFKSRPEGEDPLY